jgi:hypothetical protein
MSALCQKQTYRRSFDHLIGDGEENRSQAICNVAILIDSESASGCNMRHTA